MGFTKLVVSLIFVLIFVSCNSPDIEEKVYIYSSASDAIESPKGASCEEISIMGQEKIVKKQLALIKQTVMYGSSVNSCNDYKDKAYYKCVSVTNFKDSNKPALKFLSEKGLKKSITITYYLHEELEKIKKTCRTDSKEPDLKITLEKLKNK